MILISIHADGDVFLAYSVYDLAEDAILELACIIWVGYGLMVELVFPRAHVWASLMLMGRACSCRL